MTWGAALCMSGLPVSVDPAAAEVPSARRNRPCQRLRVLAVLVEMDLFAGGEPSAPIRQELEQAVLTLREGYEFPVPVNRPGHGVHLDVRDNDANRLGPELAPGQSPEPCQELLELERLGEAVVCARRTKADYSTGLEAVVSWTNSKMSKSSLRIVARM